jgi:hypothetical protein
MKAKKITHSFRATDTLWKAIEAAANKEGMSANEWLTLAANTQLREGVAGGEPTNLEDVGSIAMAEAANRVAAAIAKSNEIFERESAVFGSANKSK